MNIVLEMKSLLVLLFLGAVVAATLAEEPFEDEAVSELLMKRIMKTLLSLLMKRMTPIVVQVAF